MGKSKLRELWEWVDKQVEPKDDEDLKARRAKLDDITKKYFPPLGGFLGDPQDVDPAKIKRFNEKVGDYLDDVSETPERIEKKVFGVIGEATRALKPVVNDPSSLLNQASTDVGDDLTDTPASDPGRRRGRRSGGRDWEWGWRWWPGAGSGRSYVGLLCRRPNRGPSGRPILWLNRSRASP